MTREEFENMSDLAMRRLACAIIEGAVDDYRNHGRGIKRNVARIAELEAHGINARHSVTKELMRDVSDAKDKMEVLRRYFRGEQVRIIAPDLVPDAVIEALDKQIAKYKPDMKSVREFAKDALKEIRKEKK